MVAYTNPYYVIVTLLEAAMGGWDMNIYTYGKKYSCPDGTITAVNDCVVADIQEIDTYIGTTFMVLYLILQIVVILNLVIAILATTYNEYSAFERGLFYDTLIQTLPLNRNDEKFGFMTCAPSIAAPLILFLTPFVYLLKVVPAV